MIKSAFGQDFDRVVLRIFPFLTRVRVHPDVLTLLGVVVSGLAAVAFGYSQLFVGGLILMVAGFFDLVDGVVARIQGVSTRAGAFLDSSMDRVADLLVLSGIAVGLRHDVGALVLVCAVIGGSVMTSYARAKAEAELGESFSVGFVERAERVIVLILGALSGYLIAALWLVAIGSIITAVQRIVVARRRLLERETSAGSPGAGPHGPDEGRLEDAG